jgi:hypothetical protein
MNIDNLYYEHQDRTNNRFRSKRRCE